MTDEEMAFHRKWLDEMEVKTDAMVAKTPNSISTKNLYEYLKNLNVICGENVLKVTSIVCTNPITKDRWMPVDIQGRDA